MHAIHTHRLPADCGAFYAEDFTIFSMILSAMKWREKNGTITMVTDSESARYYQETGLEQIWDHMDAVLDDMDKAIDRNIFWASNKLFALSRQKAPCVILDTDFIVWEHIDFDALHTPLAVIHREPLYPDVYPNLPEFFPPSAGFNSQVLPCNTAFAYINNQQFLKAYTKTAIRFMKRHKSGSDRLIYMVFAEQRLFSICADRLELPIYSFSELDQLFTREDNQLFTHLWGFKEQMRQDYNIRYDFCKKCALRIQRDFPALIPVLERIDSLVQYL